MYKENVVQTSTNKLTDKLENLINKVNLVEDQNFIANKLAHLNADKELLEKRVSKISTEIKNYQEHRASQSSQNDLMEQQMSNLEKLVEDLGVDDDLVKDKWEFSERAFEAYQEQGEIFDKSVKVSLQKFLNIQNEKITYDNVEEKTQS